MHNFLEAELLAVEVDRRIDVIDYVADADGGHSPARCYSTESGVVMALFASRRTSSHGTSPTCEILRE
jgi:hypothetical protein